MGFKDYILPTEEVELPGGEKVAVRGLNLPDIITLVRDYGEPVRLLFAKYANKGVEDIDIGDLNGIGADLVNSAPTVAAAIIALAADEPDAISTITRLPFPVQIDALEKVGKLTFDTTGGPKKVVETVIRVLRGTTDLMVDMRLSKAGSLDQGGN